MGLMDQVCHLPILSAVSIFPSGSNPRKEFSQTNTSSNWSSYCTIHKLRLIIGIIDRILNYITTLEPVTVRKIVQKHLTY